MLLWTAWPRANGTPSCLWAERAQFNKDLLQGSDSLKWLRRPSGLKELDRKKHFFWRQGGSSQCLFEACDLVRSETSLLSFAEISSLFHLSRTGPVS